MECDGKHSHLPWGMVDSTDGSGLKFSTSLETEYPQPFCKQLASALLDQLSKQGKAPCDTNNFDDQLQKMGAGTQPRGARSPILMGEFKCKVTVTSTGVPSAAYHRPSCALSISGHPSRCKAAIFSQNVANRGVRREDHSREIHLWSF